MSSITPKTAFVTVGTTLFDDLIQNVTHPIFLEHLVSIEGYDRLVIQFGKGAIPVVVPIRQSSTVKGGTVSSSTESTHVNNGSDGNKKDLWTGSFVASNGTELRWEAYRFRPSLADDMKNASLILSHAGAGSIMEGLTYARDQDRRHRERKEDNDDGTIILRRKKVVVVINGLLMNNHQLELANALGGRGHLFVVERADMLLQKEALSRMERFVPKIFEGGDAFSFGIMVDDFMGFSSE